MKKFKSKTVLFKIQVSEGVDAVPTPADDAHIVYNFQMNPVSETIQRQRDAEHFLNPDTTSIDKRYDISFDIELFGVGAGNEGDAPANDAILQGCAMTGVSDPGVSYTYSQNTASTVFGTLYFYHDGIFYKAIDCRGSLNNGSANIKDFTKATVNMTGVYAEPVDATPGGAIDVSAYRDPVLNTEANSIFSIHSTLVGGRQFSFGQNNENALFENTELKTTNYTNRLASASAVFTAGTIAAFNPYALWNAETRDEIFWQTGTASGEIVQILMPKAQVMIPTTSDDEQTIAYNAEILPHPDSGDDELQLIFK